MDKFEFSLFGYCALLFSSNWIHFRLVSPLSFVIGTTNIKTLGMYYVESISATFIVSRPICHL